MRTLCAALLLSLRFTALPSPVRSSWEAELSDEERWTSLLWRNIQVSSDLVVLVLSRRGDYKRRKTIRSTWAAGHANVVFVIGQECRVPPELRTSVRRCALKAGSTQKVSEESEAFRDWHESARKMRKHLWWELQAFRDMIIAPVEDTYGSLAHKLRFALLWASKHSTAKWVVKTDDDHFVRVRSLEKHLMRKFDASALAVVGKIMVDNEVARRGRYVEDLYHKDRYPPFPLGSCGYALSRPVVELVARQYDNLVDYGGEDTSLGIWLEEAPAGGDVRWIDTLTMSNRQGCNSHQFLLIGHNFTSKELRSCYRKFGDEVLGSKILKPGSPEAKKMGGTATLSPILEFVPIPFNGVSPTTAAAARNGVAWGACRHEKMIDDVPCPLFLHSNMTATHGELTLKSRFSPPWEAPLRQYRTPKPFRDAVLFAVVRNPFERLIAAFACLSTAKEQSAENLNEFALRVCEEVKSFTKREVDEECGIVMLPQYYHIFDADGRKMTTHELRHETLVETMPRLTEAYGMGIGLTQGYFEDMPGHLSPLDFSRNAKECIREAFNRDFSAFGYQDD